MDASGLDYFSNQLQLERKHLRFLEERLGRLDQNLHQQILGFDKNISRELISRVQRMKWLSNKLQTSLAIC